MSSVYINNLPNPSQQITVAKVDSDRSLDMKVGFESDIRLSELRSKYLTEVITSLLLHDKMFLNTKHLLYLVDILGLDDTLKLLKADIIGLIDDKGLSFGVIDKKSHYVLVNFYDVTNKHGELNGIQWLEDRLIGHRKFDKVKSNLILINSERNNKFLDSNVNDIIKKETAYDLNNFNLTKSYGLTTHSLENISNADIYKILRIVNINRGLIYSSFVNTNNINIDGDAKSIIELKISPILQKGIVQNPNDIFTETIYKKGIPDFSFLYSNGLLKIDDILKLRNNFHGKQFRVWCEEQNFDKDEIEKGLLNSGDSLYVRIPKLLRWLIPETIGAIRPDIGLALSVAESFVIDKVLNKWHPNLFLDNELKNIIDKKMNQYELGHRRQQIIDRFPQVGRNDKCPCGSGNKFKKCCGR